MPGSTPHMYMTPSAEVLTQHPSPSPHHTHTYTVESLKKGKKDKENKEKGYPSKSSQPGRSRTM